MTTILIDADGMTPAYIRETAHSIRELLGDKLKGMRVVPVPDHAQKYTRMTVTIPIGESFAVPFMAWVDQNRRWNGWYRPAFEEHTVIKMVDALQDDYRVAEFDGHTVYLENWGDEQDDGVFYEPEYFITPAGDVVRVWWIGAGYWTWASA